MSMYSQSNWTSSFSDSASEILDRNLSRLADPLSKRLRANSFFFLSPPFIDREHGEFVKYYGLDGIQGVDGGESGGDSEAELFNSAFNEVFGDSSESFYVNLGDVRRFLAIFRGKCQGAAAGDPIVKMRLQAKAILSRAKVAIGKYSFTDGPVKEEFITLMDYALEFAASGDKVACLEMQNKRILTHGAVGADFEFKSNRSFITPIEERQGFEDIIFCTESYLTWHSYLKRETGQQNEQPTLKEFLAEFIFSLEDIAKLEVDDQPCVKLEQLRQTHLPLTAFGQFRGSVCWVSHSALGRNLRCNSIVRTLDRSFQRILSEIFKDSLLEAFRVSLSSAIWSKDDKNDYFRYIAHGFGYLFWAYSVEFWRGRTCCVAVCKGADVELDPARGEIAFDTNSSISCVERGSENIVVLSIANLLANVRRNKPVQFAKDCIDMLGFDTIVCRGLKVQDKKAFYDSEWQIAGCLTSVMLDYIASGEDIRRRFLTTMGHHIRHVVTERGWPDYARRLEAAVSQSPDADQVTLGSNFVKEVAWSLRAPDALIAPAEMIRCWDKISDTGEFPAEWQGVTYVRGDDNILTETMKAFESTIKRLASDHARIIRGNSRENFLLRDLSTGSAISFDDAVEVRMPQFSSRSKVDVSIAVMCGLTEICRNAFSETARATEEFARSGLDPCAWYQVAVDKAKGAIRIDVVNASYHDKPIHSDMLSLAKRFGERVRCVQLQQPEITDMRPPEGPSRGVNFYHSVFEYYPELVRFDDDAKNASLAGR